MAIVEIQVSSPIWSITYQVQRTKRTLETFLFKVGHVSKISYSCRIFSKLLQVLHNMILSYEWPVERTDRTNIVKISDFQSISTSLLRVCVRITTKTVTIKHHHIVLFEKIALKFRASKKAISSSLQRPTAHY